MVYELLLTSEGTILIPTDFLKRNWINVRDPTTGSVTLFPREAQLGSWERYRPSFSTSQQQKLAVSIIRACRLISKETIPILYSCNSVRFSNVRIANDFRWATYAGKANFIQELSIGKASDGTMDFDQWLEYVAKKRFGLGHDFPNLKRLTVDFCQRFHQSQLSLCATLGQHVRGLDWVHLINLDTAIDDSELHECLGPMVEESKAIGGSSHKMVLLEVTKHTIAYWWKPTDTRKHATLWLGTRNAKSPCQPNCFMIKQNETDQFGVYYDGAYQAEVQIYRLANDKNSSFPSLIRYDERICQWKSGDDLLHLWAEV